MDEHIRVLLIEDHGIIREGIHLILQGIPNVTVVADAPTGAEGVALFRRYWCEPGIGVVVTDLSLPDFDGMEVVRRIRAPAPAARVLFLSMYHDLKYIRSLLESGANGYLLKQSGVLGVARGDPGDRARGNVSSPSPSPGS